MASEEKQGDGYCVCGEGNENKKGNALRCS